MTDTCAACGRQIITMNAGASRGFITLSEVWVHVRRRRNRDHAAIPRSAMR